MIEWGKTKIRGPYLVHSQTNHLLPELGLQMLEPVQVGQMLELNEKLSPRTMRVRLGI